VNRTALALLATLTIVITLGCSSSTSSDFRSQWNPEIERPWAGPDYWTNPLQDWRITNARLENHVAGGDRNVYLLTRDVTADTGTLNLSVRLGSLDGNSEMNEGFIGFRIGIRGAFDDYRDSAVRGYGMNAGITNTGRLFIGKAGDGDSAITDWNDVTLTLSAEPTGDTYVVTLTATSGDTVVTEIRSDVQPDWLTGGLALVVHNGEYSDTPPSAIDVEETGWDGKPGTARGGNMRFWFSDWTVTGEKVKAHPERAFGPILFTMQTLSRQTVKLSAQMAPTGNAPKAVELEIDSGEGWQGAGSAVMDADSRTATFKIEDWDDTKDTPYRVLYTMPDYDGQEHQYTYRGTIRQDPKNSANIVVAAFTGNNDLGFPHADIVKNVMHHQPDLLAYTGDNIYERVGEYGIQREPVNPAILDYLRKWYLFGWEYSELLKDIPSVALPDDHDVYQGNIWGAGGRHATEYGKPGQDQGGYTMDARFVNAVQRTQTSNLPDPIDPIPIEQGILVSYTEVVYGGVSFAVIEDRKWKSAPQVQMPEAEIINGWAQNRRYDARRGGDVKGAELLGARQEKFLEDWAVNWSDGIWMKAVVSQTIFANLATLPAGVFGDDITPTLRVNKPGEYSAGDAPVQDHDSNGWPQTPRNRALKAMRKGLAFHIAGDQHLGSTIQYGIDEWRDAGWAICVPSVANVWPRRWYPPQPGKNQREGMGPNMGDYEDGFGNKMSVHAVSNPQAVGIEPTAINHRAPGYGIIKFNRGSRQINIANWPRWVDATAAGAKPYEGWPITIDQLDNGFPTDGLMLNEITAGSDDPVVEVVGQSTGELVYAVRIKGRKFIPRVREPGKYTVRVIEDGQAPQETKDIEAQKETSL
jgi:alkaline phosphatase D